MSPLSGVHPPVWRALARPADLREGSSSWILQPQGLIFSVFYPHGNLPCSAFIFHAATVGACSHIPHLFHQCSGELLRMASFQSQDLRLVTGSHVSVMLYR